MDEYNIVDIEEIVWNCWILLEYTNLFTKVKWMVIWDDTIVVNSNLNKYSKRFILAHELWHFLFWDTKDSKVWKEEKEKRADRFAIDLLLPTDELLRLYNKWYDIKALSNIFKVPELVIKNKLNLLLTHWLWDQKEYWILSEII